MIARVAARPSQLTATLQDDVATLTDLRDEWLGLLQRSCANEPMLSPVWLLTWWRIFGNLDGRRLRVVLFRQEERLVGLAPLLLRLRHHRLLPFRRLEAIGTGEAEEDSICPDYLNILAERGFEPAVATALADVMAKESIGDWDELVIPKMDGEGEMPLLLADALRRTGVAATLEVTDAAAHIPLPSTWDAYLKALSPSRRYYLNRSLRDFDKWCGGVREIRCASSPAEREEGRQILQRLHQERWTCAARRGVFASPRFTAFHEAVQEAFLESGNLELLWLCARGEPVAAVYNIVWDGKVYFYQSGRKMDLPDGVRPGVVLHAHAIRRAIELGRREYDFLAGAARYKTQLALASRPLTQLRAVRPSLREWTRRTVESGISRVRLVRNRLRAVLGRKSTPPSQPPQD
jgi:CelD/BcsL family acetyltransferase involved in cellulose biosynthesis